MDSFSHDIDLWKDFKKGNQNAFRLIHQQYYSSLYFYAVKVTQNKELSEDCIQTLFVNLWCNRENLSDVSLIKAYLFKSLRRDLNRIPYTPVLKKESEAILLSSQSGIVFSPEDVVVEDEKRQYLQQQIADVLNKLPARQREAVYLKYYEGLEYREIAQIMGVHYQSVINFLYKAMTVLKKEEKLQKLSTLLSIILFLLWGFQGTLL